MGHLIGLRTVKTGIAVTCTAIVSEMLHLQYPFYAIIATIISMESSISSSFIKGKNRMLGTTLGAIVGIIAVMIKPEDAILTGIAVIVVTTICNLLNWNGSVVISGTVVAIIMFNLNNRDPFFYALDRLGDTFIGIVIALLVNVAIKPQNFEKKIMAMNILIQEEFDHFLAHEAYDVMKLEKNIQTIQHYLNTYEHELVWTHRYRKEVNLIRDYFRCYRNILLHLKAIYEISEVSEQTKIVKQYHEEKARSAMLHFKEAINHENNEHDR